MDIAWVYGLAGGVMIGCGGAVLLLGTGRIMGASGLFSDVLERRAGAATLAFLIGLVGMPALLTLAGWGVDTQATSHLFLLICGGLAVGIGTRFANGCTSGHGVCGLSRLSVRGLVATLAYIGAGVVTVTLLRMWAGS